MAKTKNILSRCQICLMFSAAAIFSVLVSLSLLMYSKDRSLSESLSTFSGFSSLSQEEVSYRLSELEKVMGELQNDKDQGFGTHLVPLIVSIMNTRGPVYEMGSGKYSSPIIHHVMRLCGQRRLLTAETSKKWSDFTEETFRKEKYDSSWHEFLHVEEIPGANISSWKYLGYFQDWGVVFADQWAPNGNQRGLDLMRLQDRSEIVIGHDANFWAYGFNFTGLAHQYCFKVPLHRTVTLLGSNSIDVSSLFDGHGDSKWPSIYGKECKAVQTLFEFLPQYVNPNACEGEGGGGEGRVAQPDNYCMCYSLWKEKDFDKSPRKPLKKAS